MRTVTLAVVALLAVLLVVSVAAGTARAHDGPEMVAVLHDSPHSHGGVSAGGNPPAITLPAAVQLDELLVTDTNYTAEVRSDALERSGASGDFTGKESEPRSRDVRAG